MSYWPFSASVHVSAAVQSSQTSPKYLHCHLGTFSQYIRLYMKKPPVFSVIIRQVHINICILPRRCLGEPAPMSSNRKSTSRISSGFLLTLSSCVASTGKESPLGARVREAEDGGSMSFYSRMLSSSWLVFWPSVISCDVFISDIFNIFNNDIFKMKELFGVIN